MSGVLTPEEAEYVSRLKADGTLKRFSDMKGITKNGGIAIICSDGDVDISDYHKRAVSHRPHSVKLFGGPLLLCPSFRGYDRCLADGILRNMKLGVGAKNTRTFFSYFHFPCGVASTYSHTIYEVIEMALAQEVDSLLSKSFNVKSVTTFFQVKRINRGGNLEQNTYIL